MKYPAGISGEAYAAMEEGYEQGRESMRGEIEEARTRAAAAEAERDALRADGTVTAEEYAAGCAGAAAGAEDRMRDRVWDYCEMAAGMAEENPDNPYAVGLARGYRDLQAKIRPESVSD